MSGYSTYTRYQRIESQAKQLGFRLGNSKYGNYRQEFGDIVALFPDEDHLPVYSRDAEIYAGTFSEVEVWLNGWTKAQEYDMLLRLSDEKKRKQAEDKERERQRKEEERIEKRKMFAILADKTENEVVLLDK